MNIKGAVAFGKTEKNGRSKEKSLLLPYFFIFMEEKGVKNLRFPPFY